MPQSMVMLAKTWRVRRYNGIGSNHVQHTHTNTQSSLPYNTRDTFCEVATDLVCSHKANDDP